MFLVNENGDAAVVSPPSLVLKSAAEDGHGGGEIRKEEMMQMNVLENGRYNNVMMLYLLCLSTSLLFANQFLSISVHFF